MTPSSDLDRLIADWQSGRPGAESAVYEALYQRIHGIAIRLRYEQGASMQATSIVHEAFLRFRKSQNLEIHSSQHFLRLVAHVMKHVLIDRARSCKAACHGAALNRVEWSDELIGSESQADEILEVETALALLRQDYPRQARLVEYCYFAGYTLEEAAALIGYSSRQARRDMDVARVRLGKILDVRA
jgi:RNA polymerase sigma factor (TIGR02999 family)